MSEKRESSDIKKLFDANGVEIFIGDILRVKPENAFGDHKYAVVVNESISSKQPPEPMIRCVLHNNIGIFEEKDVERIGNYREHPGLLDPSEEDFFFNKNCEHPEYGEMYYDGVVGWYPTDKEQFGRFLKEIGERIRKDLSTTHKKLES